ncbi:MULTISPECIES: CAP domain-containing protein [unclassified Modestobacter]|uniref:CAP domain-containing protein n=1 Tax=unclassified Modestobacter TaxID=2643866 RepID=UPI0022AA3A70|nr:MULTISPECIES: CAP domain-containing protein [unclassified Modestobacter]MCZ2823705.1 CAP domain-containing protein [Modestobacter sp. VKM Ac-2981]MCZ2851950.1 CAP domain-containing protein [Modestobacter sp. VKM Ac-2982]
MPHRLTPPFSAGRHRSRWALVLIAVVVAAVALTTVLGGRLLPGLDDASQATDVEQRATDVEQRAPDVEQQADAGPPADPSDPAPSSTAPAPVTGGAGEPTAATTTAVPPPPPPAPGPAPAPGPTPAPPPPPPPPPQAAAPAPRTPAPSARAAPAPAPPPAAAAAPRPAAAAAPAAPGPEGQVLSLVNAERAAAGCAAVSADTGLATVARAHSADMRDRGYFSHVNPEGLDPFARARAAGLGHARAENIAAGQPDATAVMAAWMTSPGHRANILDCDLRTLGVGVATGAGGPWWTQLFGA